MSRAWMPLYVGDFLADTMHLNCQETGAYIRLLMHAWEHGGLILDDDQHLAQIVHCHPPHWPRLRRVLEPFFDHTKTPGSWYNQRLNFEMTKAAELSNKRKAAAQQMHSKKRARAEQLHTQSQSHSQRVDIDADASISPAAVWPTDFREQFWKAYPQNGHVAKSKVLAKLDVIRKSGKVEWPHLFAGVLRYAAAAHPNYTKHALTWLNGGCWDDNPAALARSKGNGKRQDVFEMVDDLADQCREREREIADGLFRPTDNVRGGRGDR